jgi:carbon starvation protein
VVGYLSYRRGVSLAKLTTVGFFIMLLSVWLGMRWPLLGLSRSAWPGPSGWMWILLTYSFVASVLPVWSLLQSRDFLNSLLLYLGMFLAYLGIFVGRPEFAAPALRLHPAGAPSFYPFVFIVIACGAASGFHSLVSSGTTAKQLNRESDARFIGYGGMIGESLLGLLAVLACTAGLTENLGVGAGQVWLHTYQDWSSVQSLGGKVGVFITGTAHFIENLGFVGDTMATAFVAVVVVSFAMTTLDSATRLLRFNISEMGETLRWRLLGNRYLASFVAVMVIAFFAFYRIGERPAGLALWRLFGTTNQLLAGLALLVVTLYLAQRGRNAWFTGVPMAFMLVTTLSAMVTNLRDYWRQWGQGGGPLFVVGSILLVLAVWLVAEALLAFYRLRGAEPKTSLQVEFPGDGGA